MSESGPVQSAGDNRLNEVPDLLYGTAFDFDNTTSLLSHALKEGYKGFDTAAVTKAYRESLAGEAVRAVLAAGSVKREEIWIQTKFSPYLPGKDVTGFPYDVITSIETQVSTSISGSLKNLSPDAQAGTNGSDQSASYLDVVVLHAPYPSLNDTLTAYHAMETFVPHKVTHLGLSNIDITNLRAVYEAARIKPILVQNRFTADIKAVPNPSMPPGIDTPEDRYDAEVRRFCREKGIVYQPWGLLWGNPNLLQSELTKTIASSIDINPEMAFTSCVQSLEPSVSILVGTSKEERISYAIENRRKVTAWLNASDDHKEEWKTWMDEFRGLIEVKG